MDIVKTIIQLICILAAAALLGNWYVKEAQRLKNAGKHWYAIYLSLPGLLIIALILLLPLIMHFK